MSTDRDSQGAPMAAADDLIVAPGAARDSVPGEPAAPLPPADSLVPHGAEAVLLETIEYADQRGLRASLTVRPGTGFSRCDGSLEGWAGPELMAQAVSAFAALRDGNGQPSIGLLLGVREYCSDFDSLPAGTPIEVRVQESSSDDQGRGVFNCQIAVAGTVAAAGSLTVFRPADPLSVLRGSGP